ncbi:MAG: DUF692 domain-containing protein [Alphaproteobacteria bacterium]|nr:DUF692 domain-containing protein [Alphaproteobacteria bacterium]
MAAVLPGPVPAAAGIGLRFPHHRAVLDERPAVGWMEVHPENYFGGGAAVAALEAVRRDWPVTLHGVGLSLGSAEGLDARHLARLAALAARIEPGLISEHVAWSVAGGNYLTDLLPLPMTEEALDVVCRNVETMQSALGRQVLVENPSSYLQFAHATIPEWEFMAAVAARTGCRVLCDVNNIAVSAHNHGFDADAYLRALPVGVVGEIHVAGHAVRPLGDGRTLRLDDHGSAVSAEVWGLLMTALARFGPVPVLVEWDTRIPPLGVLAAEAARAQVLIEEAGHARAA